MSPTDNDKPELGDWDRYEFPERDLPGSNAPYNVELVQSQGWPARAALQRLDPGLKETTSRVIRRMADAGDLPSLAMSPNGNVKWLLFSPFQVFLEDVAAEKLKELEP